VPDQALAQGVGVMAAALHLAFWLGLHKRVASAKAHLKLSLTVESAAATDSRLEFGNALRGLVLVDDHPDRDSVPSCYG
jgi:hypothetical protein